MFAGRELRSPERLKLVAGAPAVDLDTPGGPSAKTKFGLYVPSTRFRDRQLRCDRHLAVIC
jgi:hypothetical protein